MTELLNAMNACLSGVGLAAVSDVDDDDLDAANAKTTILRVSKEIQSKGWFFNKEPNWNLVPDSATGRVAAPPNALSIVSDGYSRNMQVALRNGQLYDLINHTYDVSSLANYTLDGVACLQTTFIFYLEFNNLPPVAQIAIRYTARRQFAQDLEVDEKRWKFQSEEEKKAMALLEKEEMRNRKHNYLTDNPNAALFQAAVGGRNSRSFGLSVYPRRNSY